MTLGYTLHNSILSILFYNVCLGQPHIEDNERGPIIILETYPPPCRPIIASADHVLHAKGTLGLQRKSATRLNNSRIKKFRYERVDRYVSSTMEMTAGAGKGPLVIAILNLRECCTFPALNGEAGTELAFPLSRNNTTEIQLSMPPYEISI
ncbi:hypothetical protein J6590_039918 [Homalodisca vitripennis]|nr:hypothetical protein J6590_039918 [Homalodisca vitripennis]